VEKILQNLMKKLFIGSTIAILMLCDQAVYSHTIEISEDVGATFHIEPNDIAKAGKSAQVWFALTKIGGTVISLNSCDCRLSIYNQPRSSNSQPILRPQLVPLSAEGYKDVPSTSVIFPKVGSYELELIGKPVKKATFKPFKFKFKVTVAG